MEHTGVSPFPIQRVWKHSFASFIRVSLRSGFVHIFHISDFKHYNKAAGHELKQIFRIKKQQQQKQQKNLAIVED